MSPPSTTTTIDPRSGYNYQTKTFHSLRPPTPLPPSTSPLSLPSYILSILPSPLPSNPAFILHSPTTPTTLSFPSLLSSVRSLASSLPLSLPKSSVALVLSPPSLHLPVLHLSLLSRGLVVSPLNPLSSPSEILHVVRLSNPRIAFTTSSLAPKLPPDVPKILLDSPHFLSLLSSPNPNPNPDFEHPQILQSDPAAVLYSSGTTGKIKGAVITHRNFIALIASMYFGRKQAIAAAGGGAAETTVALLTVPMFHVYGFFMMLRNLALGDVTVLMERVDFGEILVAVERYRVTAMSVAPPLVVAMVKSDEALRRDLSSLRIVGSGGAPLGREVAERFKARFPNVDIFQGYGLTETTGAIASAATPEEVAVYGSTGRLGSNVEAKVVDPETGEAVGPGRRGELWVRGPTIMKGYIGDDKATAQIFDSEGWLKTGDLCYINEDGFLFIVDRIKELIKYKAYQVAPAELEQILQSHPEIEDAAVVPYPDEEAGEIPMAFIVRKPGSHITEEQVMDFVAKQVAPYKKIRRVEFINSIPKNQAGKILRRELRNRALSLPKSKL